MKKVISASRRVDMLCFYPEEMVSRIRHIGAEHIHTLVIWTKNPEPVFANEEVRHLAEELDQILITLSITGLGGTYLEPAVPCYEKVLEMLPGVIRWVGRPERVNIRYDPLVDVDTPHGRLTNMDPELFRMVARAAGSLGIPILRLSYVATYPKVLRRFNRFGIHLREHPMDEVVAFIKDQLMPIADLYGTEVRTCTMPSFTRGGCIDGADLSRLHPHGEPCSLAKDSSQRPTCQCTQSLDIGLWNRCLHGCRYCYGNPVEGRDVENNFEIRNSKSPNKKF